VSAEAIEQAIELNGVAVETNTEAFRLGRRLAADPSLAQELGEASATVTPTPPAPTAEVQALIDLVPSPDDRLVEVLRWRVPELIEWGDSAYARSYIDEIAGIRRSELSAEVDGTELSETAARQLFKLMAYKDEYEVARLALLGDVGARARARFGPNAKVSFQLKPPTLKSAGYDRKIPIPESVGRAAFRSLARTRRLRGTRFDPFGRTEERKIERELIDDYRGLLHTVGAALTPERHQDAVELLELADQIRGFDDVKLANVARYRAELAERFQHWQ
jgi:indolepyruvate ferredoxin oxidoreductase